MKNPLVLLTVFMMTMACNRGEEVTVHTEPPINKPNIQVVDGQFTPEIMHQLGKVSDPQLSPDATKILYGVAYTDIKANKSQRHLFVMDVDGQNNKKITAQNTSLSNARWYKDGEYILFLMKGQLYSMKANASGIIHQVSNVPNGISGFELSPDHSKIYYISQIRSAAKPTDVYPDLPKSSGRIITDLMYRHWDCFVENIPRTFVADLDNRHLLHGGNALKNAFDLLGEEPYELPTLPFGGTEQLSWSADGKMIAYACRKVTGKDYAFSTNTDIYLYNLENGQVENITEGNMGYDTDPRFSPDGRYIAWVSMERGGFEADKQRLFVMDIQTRTKTELSKDYGYNVQSPVWMDNSQGLYFTSLVNALQGVFETDLTGNIRRITSDKVWNDFGGVAMAANGRLITTYTSMCAPAEIVSIDPVSGEFVALTHENDAVLAQLKETPMEERWITTTDNKKMHTWVVYPTDFDPNKKYPALLFCTGGPQGTISQGWSTRWNPRLMAAQGYIVILPNRRGTTAFGQEWCDQISGDYMGQNMQDYLSAVKDLKKEKFVGKVGAAGASYGGFSIYYLAGIHDGMFSAFLSHAGIFNQEQMYLMTEELWFPTWDNGGAPWDNNPIARRHYANSAHKLIKNWDTPIMVTHGEMDYRVPVEQGMAAFNAAQMMGVPSEMLLFPEENHWILKPQNSIHWHRSFFAWFDKWLKTE